jgi:predicted lipoprotein with Yx(FWY)xxD motif
MTPTHSLITGLAAAVLATASTLAVAACGSGGTATAITPPKTASGAPATVGIASTVLGKVLVNSEGRTVYLFDGDMGGQSTCSGACASAWPPLMVNGKPTVGSGTDAALVGTAKRSDGTSQLTYNGHPVYLFAQDAKAGELKGQGVSAFGARWYVVSSAGNQITSKPPSGEGGRAGGAAGY